MLVKLETIKKKLQTDLDHSTEVIDSIKQKLKLSQKETLEAKLKEKVLDERIRML